MGRLLQALERQIDIYAAGEAANFDIIVGVADFFVDYPARCHLPKEDLVVAKLLESHPGIDDEGELFTEHGELHERSLGLCKAVNRVVLGVSPPRSELVDVARDFVAGSFRHMSEEEGSLFPTAERVLGPAEWADIEDRLLQVACPNEESSAGPMFRRLSDRLLALEPKVGERAI